MTRKVNPATLGGDDLDDELLFRLHSAVKFGRERKGWSRRELAERSGVSERFLASIEAEQANPSVLTVAAIGRVLGLTVAQLLTEGGSVHPRLATVLYRVGMEDQVLLADEVAARFPRTGEEALRIALVGLRGAGKSTVGALLAQRLRVPFVELDKAIEARAQLSLTQVFELHGEAHYRKLEREVLSSVIAEKSRVVIATGGGLPMQAATYGLLKDACRTVWLKAKPGEYLSRVLKQGDRRPVEARPQALAELKQLLAAREPAYRQAAFTVETSGVTAARVVERVEAWVKRAEASTRAATHPSPRSVRR